VLSDDGWGHRLGLGKPKRVGRATGPSLAGGDKDRAVQPQMHRQTRKMLQVALLYLTPSTVDVLGKDVAQRECRQDDAREDKDGVLRDEVRREDVGVGLAVLGRKDLQARRDETRRDETRRGSEQGRGDGRGGRRETHDGERALCRRGRDDREEDHLRRRETV